MKTRYLAILATLAFLGFSVPAAAHDCIDHKNQDHKHCGADPAPSGGGKALLFEIAAIACDANPVSVAASFGHVSWAGNVLWDPENIHVHFKLQLKDVDPGTYDVLGNNDGAGLGRACGTGTPDFPLCEGGVCDLKITVKQKGQGRTSGVLRLPGCDPGETTTVWVTVTVTVNGEAKILRSTPITIVLPPNEVGTGQSCIE